MDHAGLKLQHVDAINFHLPMLGIKEPLLDRDHDFFFAEMTTDRHSSHAEDTA